MVLSIKFVTLEGKKLYRVVRLAKSNVTAKAVEAKVNAFTAPDLHMVVITNGEGSWFNITADKPFNKKDFAQWWKKAKLGL